MGHDTRWGWQPSVIEVTQAVEAGEVPADLLTDLQAESNADGERPQEAGSAAAVQPIADRAGVPEEEAAKVLVAIEVQPSITRGPPEVRGHRELREDWGGHGQHEFFEHRGVRRHHGTEVVIGSGFWWGPDRTGSVDPSFAEPPGDPPAIAPAPVYLAEPAGPLPPPQCPGGGLTVVSPHEPAGPVEGAMEW